MNLIKVSPSLMCMNFLHVGQQIHILNTLATSFHFDIIDYHFTPTFGLPLEFLIAIKKVVTIPIDIHLMVNNVKEVSEQLISIGVDMITLHIETITSNAFRVIRQLKDHEIKVGIAINPITPINYVYYLLEMADKFTVMTFDPGVAGQKLVDVTLRKVSQLAILKQDNSFSYDIEVDGSCNQRNFSRMRGAGANQFVVGTSGLFSLDPQIEIAWQKMTEYMSDETIYRQ